MRTDLLRTLLAIGALVCTTSIAAASEVGYSNMERRRAARAPARSAAPGVRQVAHFSDISTHEELPSSARTISHETYGMPQHHMPMEWCSDDCSGGCHHGCPPSQCHYPMRGMYYTEAQIMFLRPHVLEDAAGKLSEKYEFSPRFIVGYESPSGWGARTRYWTYGRTTQILRDTDSLRLDFDVIDVEGTTRFSSQRAELLLSGGFRWVNADVGLADESVGASMPGLTAAADVRLPFCRACYSEWSGVFGARWSILGCDWEGDGGGLIDPTHDDNVTVQELYGGVEYVRHYHSCDVYLRAVFEVQNWHSDALGSTSATDSIGFVGPGLHFGATF